MWCKNCGFQNNQTDIICKQCRTRLQQPVNNQAIQQSQSNLNYQGMSNSASNQNYINNAVNPNMKKWAILSIILSITSIMWYWFIGLSFYYAFVLAIIGFNLAQKGEMADKKLAIVGKVLSGILIGMAIFMFVIQVMKYMAQY